MTCSTKPRHFFFFFAEVPKDMDAISSEKGIVMLQRLQRSLLDFR